MPTYLKDDWFRDWGALQRLTPFYPNAEPARLDLGTRDPQRAVEPRPAAAELTPSASAPDTPHTAYRHSYVA